MSGSTQENEVRHLLSRAWSRRRRKAKSPNVRNALHLDLNREFESSGESGVKYLLLMAVLFALLIYAVSHIVGLEYA